MKYFKIGMLTVSLGYLALAGTMVFAESSTDHGKAERSNNVEWLDDYPTAVKQAKEAEKMLLVYFRRDASDDERQRQFESSTLADKQVQERIKEYVRVKIPVETTVKEKGKEIKLLSHRAFKYMYGKNGICVVDYQNADKPYFGYVVSCFPFERPAYYCSRYESVSSFQTILNLPPGSITQRTMVYAVRMHPERPSSTNGRANSVLLSEAEGHSQHQANIRLQGHHGWDSRFQRIWSRIGHGSAPTEVCAESWAGQGLVAACLDCVHSWRQSPGHWSAVRGRQRNFGYDIRRGGNGIWYATGIFGG